MPHFSGGETTSHQSIDTFGRHLITFEQLFRKLSLQAESNPGNVMFISLYLALVYLKPLPELGQALPLQRKMLSDVIMIV